MGSAPLKIRLTDAVQNDRRSGARLAGEYPAQTPTVLDTQAASLIAVGLPMDVMALGCTSASMVIGSKKVEELLTVHHPGIPATNH